MKNYKSMLLTGDIKMTKNKEQLFLQSRYLPIKKTTNHLQLILLLNLALILPIKSYAQQTFELTTAYQDSYPKYYMLDEEKIYKGICIEIYKELTKELTDIRFNTTVNMASMSRVDIMLNTGEIDFFIGMAKNKKREENFYFIPTPLYSVNHVIAQHIDDIKKFLSFSDIKTTKNTTILTNKGSSTARLLKTKKGLTIDDGARTLEANIKKLAYKRGRILYFHDLGLYSTLKKSTFINRIHINSHSFKNYEHYLVVRKDLPIDIIKRINDAVLKLKNNGTLDNISKKYFSI